MPVELHLCQVDTVYLRTRPNTFRQTQQVVHLQYFLRNVFAYRVPISSVSDFLVEIN